MGRNINSGYLYIDILDFIFYLFTLAYVLPNILQLLRIY